MWVRDCLGGWGGGGGGGGGGIESGIESFSHCPVQCVHCGHW